MTHTEIRQKFLKFFEERGHKIVPSSSLIPENDPTTLFTNAGMQPMIPYLLGGKHPLGTKITDSQRCFRTQDIKEVGDNRHTTFFEMLGNWSFGDYFKKEQISWLFEFLTKEIKLDPKRLYVSVFRGNPDIDIPRDEESAKIWQKEFEKVGVEANIVDFAEKDGIQSGRIFYYDETKNWWSRVGVPSDMPDGEPGGPDSEIFWDFGENLKIHENSIFFKNQPCHINCDCGRFLEIGNSVFMEYVKTGIGFKKLKQKNVDFGGGLERITAASIDMQDIFKIDIFVSLRKLIEKYSGKQYEMDKNESEAFRVIMDHLRAATFLIADGAKPLNKEQGYFTRRLIRRAVRFAYDLDISDSFYEEFTNEIIDIYSSHYLYLQDKRLEIINTMIQEVCKFKKTLAKGLKKLEEYVKKKEKDPQSHIGDLEEKDLKSKSKHFVNSIPGKDAFDLYQTYGFPPELIQEELAKHGMTYHIEEFMEDFDEEFKKHQELSRTASAGMFKGGLADASVETTRLHTTAHLMLEALRRTLGDHVQQKGSNITSERLRFDFSHPEKVTSEQIAEVEKIVNEQIQKKLPVHFEEMSVDEAKKIGATGVFEHKYGEKVKVYMVGEKGNYFSKEICGGPHVSNTDELGHFKIIKEESASAGVRRIKAILE